jgi:hypothetical protein
MSKCHSAGTPLRTLIIAISDHKNLKITKKTTKGRIRNKFFLFILLSQKMRFFSTMPTMKIEVVKMKRENLLLMVLYTENC